MGDLIERDKIYEAVYDLACKSVGVIGGISEDYACGLREAAHMIEEAPAVDAVPVVHGQWIGEADGYADGELVYDVWICSKCDYCIDDGTDNPELLPNYCPNCGAKMDEEGETK
nr:MAG TPA: hypothetical protein [Caudoviricetes sp.]